MAVSLRWGGMLCAIGLGLAACGGGGGPGETALAVVPALSATTAPTVTSVGAADIGSSPASGTAALPAGTPVAAPAVGASMSAPAAGAIALEATASTGAVGVASVTAATPALATPTKASTPASSALASAPQPPVLPRASITAAELAVVIAAGDATSEAIGRAYQAARGIAEAQMVRVPVPAGSDVISAAAFAKLEAAIDAALSDQVQATLLTFTQPSRVQGDGCSMSITSALAFGFSASFCGQCSRTQASAYHDSDSTRPWTELKIRPSMMLGAATLEAAQALIARGLAAEGSSPSGTGHLVRTTDVARSVRHPDFQALPAAWSQAPDLALRYLDLSAAGSASVPAPAGDMLFYFTGLAQVPQLGSNRFLPGAVADHLTSFGGLLPGANGQMPATAWLAAGATASYGTVEEPCNYIEKFPKASVLIDHYLRGATVIEAYWKSVAWPGQGLFLGEPLARPWPDAASAVIEGGELLVRTRSLRRNGAYRVDYRAAANDPWRVLAAFTAGQPQPLSLRLPLPTGAGGQLRWVGPCPTQPATSCVLAASS